MADYKDFLAAKQHVGVEHGFEPTWMPDMLFPFQVALVEWATRKGRAAIFADCGLGKTFIQIVWAENVCRKTDGRVLILTPLAVSFQTVLEGEKLGVEVAHRRDGIEAGDRIVVTNYERLHHFDASDFAGVVCDESSILKNFDGMRKAAVTEFMRTRPYRLLCTATAAPNDYIELGTSSEALGCLSHRHMLAQYFTHDSGHTSQWRLKGHTRTHLFWQYVCTWARAIRTPSDMGFKDDGFLLPSLVLRDHVVQPTRPASGMLFDLPAIGLTEQREERWRTLDVRCGQAAELINAHDRPAVAWCHLNAEGDLLAKLIPDAVQVAGGDSDDWKEQAFRDFAAGNVRVIVTKPTIAGFGLNWQHCAHQTFFPSHSYEQYYQAVRRCWRFGQTRDVTIDIVTTEGQLAVMDNLTRKAQAAARMFDSLVALMWDELDTPKKHEYTQTEEVPAWL